MNRVPAAAALAVIVLFAALGVWQLERRTWKLALIARVERRLAAPPVIAPPSAGPADEYRRVRARGRWLACRTRLAQAVTVLGPGYWVMTPLADARGFTLFVNRGFVPQGMALPPCRDGAAASVTGLLRISEPDGGFLRANDPAAGRWYSRDVAAMGRGLPRLAPYFVDADAPTTGWPRGGMTVVRFRNTHLVYALTWFGLAALVAAMAWRAVTAKDRRA